ncbi:MAG: GDP-mannose 4,6-dehydratase [Trichodesmium sp. ALOHA_ZT_67]|nr:GDP-mannose 4,6-dehydratase [Trichodesmium sp. ALOHA_ZT_67]
MKTALISGISGQDGSYLAKLLLEKGYNVCGTSRDAQMSTFKNLSYLGIREQIKLDSMSLNDFRSVLQILTKYQPDEIYNLAGQSSVGLSFEQPVETLESIATGTLNLLEAIRFIGEKIKLYNASSSECFGDTEGQTATEITPFRPRSPYAVAKSAAFWEVANYREAYNLFACSGILFNHESPLRPQRFVTQKIVSVVSRIAQGSKEKLSLGNISVQRDWGWAPEYVKAMFLMLQQDKPDDYIIATGKTYSLQDFVLEAFAAVGLNWQDYVEIDKGLYRPTDIFVSKANPIKAEQKLGWKADYKMPDVVRMMLKDRMANLEIIESSKKIK